MTGRCQWLAGRWTATKQAIEGAEGALGGGQGGESEEVKKEWQRLVFGAWQLGMVWGVCYTPLQVIARTFSFISQQTKEGGRKKEEGEGKTPRKRDKTSNLNKKNLKKGVLRLHHLQLLQKI